LIVRKSQRLRWWSITVAPAIVYNYGLIKDWELVLEGRGLTPLSPSGPTELTDAGAFLKHTRWGRDERSDADLRTEYSAQIGPPGHTGGVQAQATLGTPMRLGNIRELGPHARMHTLARYERPAIVAIGGGANPMWWLIFYLVVMVFVAWLMWHAANARRQAELRRRGLRMQDAPLWRQDWEDLKRPEG
jgi:hypothetical protein